MKPELLAPAGDIEAAYAALFYGADALYLGLRQFSARATATNFSPEQLCEITGFAHSKGAKVYVTINTVLQEEQLNDLMSSLKTCQKANVDAIIIQDLGVAQIAKKHFPTLQLHASTQMAVHNYEGALALKELGFSRIVLAREMTLPEIEKVSKIEGLETEAFIHGALCYAYSGLCLFSSLETGMSANRGKCLYPCRAEFDGDLGKKHLFSMKDMALQEDVLKMPVTSLKIEGRKKTALYVAAVVNYYRRLIDKKPTNGLDEDIRQIFARPWTKLHFNGKNKDVIDTDFVGHRGLKIGAVKNVIKGILTFIPNHDIERYDGIQIDIEGQEKPFGFSLEKMRVQGKNVFQAKAGTVVEVSLPPKAPFITSGAPVYLASSSKVKGKYHYDKPKAGSYGFKHPIDVFVEIKNDFIVAQAEEWKAQITESFSKAQNIQKVNQSIHDAFDKTGDTPFKLNDLTIENKDDLFVPVSILNQLRRQLYAQIQIKEQHIILPDTPNTEHTFKGYIVKTDKPEILQNLNDFVEAIILLNPDFDFASLKSLPKNKIRLALPAVCRHPDLYKKTIQKALDLGYKKWEIGNYWGLSALTPIGLDLTFDNSIYTLNSYAIKTAKELGAKRITFSFEDTAENLQNLAGKSILPTVFVAYSDVPLFISANCIRPHDCKQCAQDKKWFSLNKGKERYDVLSVPCQTILMNKKALYLGQHTNSIQADYIRIDLLYKKYDFADVNHILNAIKNKQAIPSTDTGNWQKRI